jgi:hypothetical protein
MSANNGILTYNSGIFNATSIYYSPSAIIPTTGQIEGTLYCFLSRVQSWDNDILPPAPTQDQKYIKQAFKNMFVAKKITSNDISPVIERIDWSTGIVYDYYRDDIDMYTLDINGSITKHFYVKNKFDQVFKCLWNNDGGVSTNEPYFEPGTFNANLIFQGADNYKWKYMYTITSGNKLKFMDDAWMPVPVGTHIPNPVSTNAGIGDIPVINVINGGTNYNPATNTITVVITGDGTGASANVVMSGSTISDITLANTGSNYTYANVSIVSEQGSGAQVVAYTSPIGGHGYDPASELGSRHAMLTCTFEKDENGKLPTDIDFRQLGVLVNPFAYFGTTVQRANASVYSATTDFVVSQGFGVYTPDEIVFQSTDGTYSADKITFSATVLSFDSTTNTLKLINKQGTAISSGIIYGNSTGTARVILEQRTPEFIPFSGYMIYLENREPIQRNSDGSEQFKLVLGY